MGQDDRPAQKAPPESSAGGDSLFDDELFRLAKELVALYRRRGLMLASAESCTGGLVAAVLTEVAGSSAVVERGFVTYSNEAKEELLGVAPALLAAHGAVSAEVAGAMARGALDHSRADITVAITGIAGPGGGTPEKPVGLVYFASGTRTGDLIGCERRFGDLGRAGIRRVSVLTALAILRDRAN